MKAMILAAGKGTRMLPLTEQTPKPLLHAGPRRLIEWQILNLHKAGIHQIVINCHHLGEQIQECLGDGSRYGVSLQYSFETQLLDTAGGIIRALSLLQDEYFIVTNADVWTDYPFERLIQRAGQEDWTEGQRQAHLVLVHNPPHHPQGDFHLGNDGLLAYQQPASGQDGPRLTYAGISLLHGSLFANQPQDVPLPLVPLLRQAMDANEVSGEVYAGEWQDIGTPQRLQALDRMLN